MEKEILQIFEELNAAIPAMKHDDQKMQSS
jgi:hypothetical protein